ncbi:hypothetical protein ACQRBV_22735 [Pseudomonas sp. R11F]|uniref:hypothetical protein n=1 Tax=Pseudomonas TaxID=286 RepID=UPI00398EC62E
MTDYTELKRLAEAIHGQGSTMQMLARWREFEHACEPKIILALIAENDRLESERADLWRGKRDVEATRDTKSAVIAELKAEIAGLKTGYEAYERVNAELKAENEALRSAFRPLLAHWDDLKAGDSLKVDAARAAMGNGGQS